MEFNWITHVVIPPIRLYDEDCETLIAFIKMHEREEIPDDVWDICMKLYDAVYGVEVGYDG